IGREAREQVLAAEKHLPAACVACVGGGSNAAGLFAGFVDDKEVELWGVEAAGDGVATGRHAATLTAGRVAVLHGSKSYVLCDDGKTKLVIYRTAGDPEPDATAAIIRAAADAGADAIELGVPFSDPSADGPAIQLAMQRALAHHVGLGDVLDMVRAVRAAGC